MLWKNYLNNYNNSAKVIVIFPVFEQDVDIPRKCNMTDIANFKEIFKPAIANEILVVKTVKLGKEEIKY